MTNTIKSLIISFLFITNLSFSIEDKYGNKKYYSDNEIDISYQYKNCEYLEQFDKEYVMLGIQNKSNKELKISWQELLWYDNK